MPAVCILCFSKTQWEISVFLSLSVSHFLHLCMLGDLPLVHSNSSLNIQNTAVKNQYLEGLLLLTCYSLARLFLGEKVSSLVWWLPVFLFLFEFVLQLCKQKISAVSPLWKAHASALQAEASARLICHPVTKVENKREPIRASGATCFLECPLSLYIYLSDFRGCT